MKLQKRLSATLALCLGAFTAAATDTNILAWPASFLTNVPNLRTNAIAVTGGDAHGIALLADRTVQMWGYFAYGSGSMVPVADETNIVGIAAGSSHALAVRSDGTVAMWGRLLGDGTAQVSPAATNVVALGVGPGAQHALALRADGSVVDWGYPATTNIPPGVVNIVSVAAGDFYSLALRSDGRVLAWGNTVGVPASATNIVAIATTWSGNLALRADGKLLTWNLSPTLPNQATLSNIVEVAGAGNSFGGGMALSRNGTVFAAGAPSTATNIMTIGGAGNPTQLAVKALGPPIFPLPAVRRTVAATQTAFLRLRAVGALPMTYQWSFQGTNLPAATNEVLMVTNALPPSTGFYSLVASNAFGVITNSEMRLVVASCVITNQSANQTVYAGANSTLRVGVLGKSPSYQWTFNGTNLLDVTASTLTLTNTRYEQAGRYTVIASITNAVVTNTATLAVVPVAAWGSSTYGQTKVPQDLTNVVVIAWGLNSNGQTDVPGDLSNVVAVAAGYLHCIALSADGTVAVWGATDSYGLGSIPAAATDVVAVGAGYGHCLALKDDGTVVAWGYWYNGETSIPTGLQNVTTIAGGNSHNLALVGGAPFGAQVEATNPSWSTNGFGVAVPTQNGRVYRLEHKENLSDSNWIAYPLVAGTGGIVTMTDTAASGSQRFYRVRRW